MAEAESLVPFQSLAWIYTAREVLAPRMGTFSVSLCFMSFRQL